MSIKRYIVWTSLFSVLALVAGCSADKMEGSHSSGGHFDPQLAVDSANVPGPSARSSGPHYDPQLAVDSANVTERPARSSGQHFDPQLSVDTTGPAEGSHKSAGVHSDSRVSIDNFTFSPETLTVQAGTKVTWVNHDDVPHTATSRDKPRVFNSGALDTDQQFSYVFATAGTYPYFCAVHPHMTGQIIVK